MDREGTWKYCITIYILSSHNRQYTPIYLICHQRSPTVIIIITVGGRGKGKRKWNGKEEGKNEHILFSLQISDLHIPNHAHHRTL